MSAKLLNAVMSIAIAGLFYVPSAHAGVFQLVEISQASLEERLSEDPNDDGNDDQGEGEETGGNRSIDGDQPVGEPSVLGLLLQLFGFAE